MAAWKKVMLPSGAVMPTFGLGLYKARRGAETYEAVRSALAAGYRLIDTAQWYRNEQDVGRALRDSKVPRADVFVTTKLWVSHWGYDRATTAIQECRERLGVEYIDLLLLHAPGDAATRDETWRALEDAKNNGTVRDIGVSNFGVKHLEKLMRNGRERPAVNQIELHPWLARTELVEWCRAHDIVVEAYSPLAKATRLTDPTLVQIAASLRATPAQVLIAYSLAKGYVTVAKSVSPERQQENWDGATVLALPPDSVARLDALDAGIITAWDPMSTHEV